MIKLETPNSTSLPLGIFPCDRETAQLAQQFSEFAEFGHQEGVLISPYTDARLPNYALLEPQERAVVSEVFEQYFQVMSQVKHEERRLLRNLTTVWRMISKARLMPCHDLFSKVSEEDVVEIYDASSRQIFRSFNFFPLCTYSLEELYTIPWFDLYERPDKQIQDQQLGLLMEFINGRSSSTMSTPIAQHIVRERREIRGTSCVRCNLIEPLYVSPLFDRNGKLGGYINAFRSVKNWDEVPPPLQFKPRA